VVVGAGQLLQRPDRLEEALEPVELMAEAAAVAARDCGSSRLVAGAGLVAAVQGAWSYPDPARVVADRLGAGGARTARTANGGNTPQSVLNILARRIAAGDLDAAVLVGGETIWSRRRQRAQGIEQPMTDQGDARPAEVLGADLVLGSEEERAAGVEAPIHFYPMFESAIRYARRESLDAHRDRISRLAERFNRVAVANPYAWSRQPMTAAEIREPSPDNRMVGFPYTKAMNSNWDLDQAAAVVICSAEAAAGAGVPRDRWVFLHAGTDAREADTVSERWALGEFPGLAAAARRLLELGALGPDDLDHVDLYSCFPSAVQAGAVGFGLSEDRDLTVTGGLIFAGGPLNNYVTHSVAAMTGVLRSDPGSRGLVTAVGGFLSKHAMGVYSTDPPSGPFVWEDATPGGATRAVAAAAEGPATVEAYTVMHSREGPEVALFACLLPDGRRAWAHSSDPAVMKGGTTEELIGRPARLDGSRSVTVE
jgi:acetyl-CoA C-acetyltransferase